MPSQRIHDEQASIPRLDTLERNLFPAGGLPPNLNLIADGEILFNISQNDKLRHPCCHAQYDDEAEKDGEGEPELSINIQA